MSYSVNWIEPIMDRAMGDIYIAQDNPDQKTKGAYNNIDLHRIENNIIYVAEDMLARGIILQPVSLKTRLSWSDEDISTRDDVNRIINNILLLQSLSNVLIWDSLEPIQTASQMTYTLANSIETNLLIMKNQPVPVPDTYLLELVNGYIPEVDSNKGRFEEDKVVVIRGVPYGERPNELTFDRWIGNTEDLQFVGDVYAQQTTFTMWHKDVRITAQFKSSIPRTFKITNGKINDGSGRTSGTFYAGDILPILANDAPTDMVFYEWQGTKNALYNLTDGVNANNNSFVMPDEDVTFNAFYVHPGKHLLTVNNGSGGGWYEYGRKPFASANDRGKKYSFSHWSYDTSHIDGDSTTSPSVSVFMPDYNIRLDANYTYNYSYNTIEVTNGTGSGTNKKEGSSVAIVAGPAPEGEGFDYWSRTGVGSFQDSQSASTNFIVGDGDAVITAHYKPLRYITTENVNNNGGVSTKSVVEGKQTTISTNTLAGDYIFDYWEEDGVRRSTSTSYTFTVGSVDRTFKAIYRLRNYYNLTINDGTGSGRYMERQTVSISFTGTIPEGKQWSRWNTSGLYSINDTYSKTTSVTIGSSDATATPSFSNIPTYIYHNLTVLNGNGSGQVAEGSYRSISVSSVPQYHKFSHWEIVSGEGSFSNMYNSTTNFYIGKTDAQVQAVFTEIPFRNLTVVGGRGSGQYRSGTRIRVIADDPPKGMTFFNWTGDVNNSELSDVFASTTDVVSISKDMTIYANNYIPEEVDRYMLTVLSGYGSGKYPGGSPVEIEAHRAPDGYEFDKWTRDVGNVLNKYLAKVTMIMPLQPATVEATYKRQGSTTLYTLTIAGGECLIKTDEDGKETWNYTGDYERGTIVKIRANQPPNNFQFDRWIGDVSTVTDLNKSETTITIEEEDLYITGRVIEKEKYVFTAKDGHVSGTYYEGDLVHLYFGKEDTEDTHYIFKKWIGDTSFINPNINDQTFRMPAQAITVEAVYDTKYKLSVIGGTFDGDEFLLPNTEKQIIATQITEQEFYKWSGHIELIDHVYSPKILLVSKDYPMTLKAQYRTPGQNNDFGNTSLTLEDTNDIIKSDITIISGEIRRGMLITDVKGHIGLVINTSGDNVHLIRLTKIQGGAEDGE